MKILRKICARQHLFSTIFVCLLTVLVVSFSLSPFLVPHGEATENFWTTMAEMPTARAGLGVAVVDGKMYAIGGSDGRYLTANEMYDPSKDTWATKKSMPTKRGYFGIAVHQNKVYVIGGETGDGPTGVNEVYDPATDTWETKTSMPTPRENLCANVVNGKIYLIGGNTFNTLAWPVLSNKTEVYDPSTDSWTTRAAMPNFEGLGFADIASAAVNNKVYVIGGEEWAITDLNQIYDPETDTWSSGTSMPTAVEGPAAGATTGVFAPKRIHVLSMDLHHVYYPETDVWSTGTQMPTPRRHLGVAVISDRLYAIGGGFSGDFGFIETNENEQYTPSGYIPEFPDTTPPFPTWVVAAIVIVAAVGVALLVYFVKIKKTTGKAE